MVLVLIDFMMQRKHFSNTLKYTKVTWSSMLQFMITIGLTASPLEFNRGARHEFRLCHNPTSHSELEA